MGRPEPCVLFAQTFVHPQLDEYVDEVLFAEPVVITACEFLEQNASSTSRSISLVGATSPPSFALEVFVQCEGETRFRRLCQPFLYSHSSSNVLEVEAVVTNHLVVRGSYRSLSLAIYGNTAEDLGQFNIEFDDSSLTDLVSFADGKLEDLPWALRTIDRTIEESLSPLNILSFPAAALDVSLEVKQLLHLALKILNMPNLGSSVHKVVRTLVYAASSYVACDINGNGSNQIRTDGSKVLNGGIDEAKKELSEIYEALQQEVVKESIQSSLECIFMESDVDCSSSKQLVDSLCSYFNFASSINHAHHELPASDSVILGLTLALFLCSGREGCFHFVSCGGMDHLAQLFTHDILKSTTITLLLLGVVEQATRHSVGCEGFLGWWPREDESIPSGASERYNHLLKMLLQKPRHDVASLTTYVLHRLRFYEVASRYEHAVLSMLGNSSAVAMMEGTASDMLVSIKSLLKKLLHLMSTNGQIEDPSPAAHAEKLLLIGQSDGMLSYKATGDLISSSSWCFSDQDIDSYLLALLKERGFLPLSAALLSTPIMHSEAEDDINVSMDVVSSIGLIILSLLFCRSGLIFLLHDPELIATVIRALKGADDMNKEECVPLRYASVLLSKGFTCSSREVGVILEMHLRVVNAIDRMLISTPQSEEFLWVLWELCGLSRSDCGHQALLALSYFPEAVSVLIEALHCAKESEVTVKTNDAAPLDLAILHSAAEILELIVMDSTASSTSSWIEHAMELHEALHSSSPGSNRKDAPTRLLEWIDAGLVYHKNGAVGLLRYAAVLISGGDAQLTSTNIPVSDLTDVDNVGESSTADVNVIDNLAKIIYDKSFDGVNLRDSATTQLTTAFRILAYITENSAVATALYDEGVISVIYAVLVNCSFMLERTSSSYDYLVDEGTECHSTSDILLERNREQSLVDLLVPCLLLLNNLLQKLQQVKEHHRNTKLMNVLLRLHREVSLKLAACAADLSSPYPDSALGFEAVCHLVVSALAYWPVNGWTPGLFHSLLASVQAASLLALGPKETCSLLCLLNDLFPEEGVWLWKNGMPLLSALRTLAIGTLLGPQKERQVNWYLECRHVEKLLNQLTPQLDKISQVIQNYAVSALVVIQDMLRVFLVRVAAQKAELASKLIRPIILWMQECISESASPLDTDFYKAYRFLEFMAHLLEHPYGKALLIGEGVVQILAGVLRKCFNAICSERKQLSDSRDPSQYGVSLTNWCPPVFLCISHLVNSGMSLQLSVRHDRYQFDNLSSKDCSLFLQHLLKFCQVLPIGKELIYCLLAFQDLVSCPEGRSALASAFRCPSSALEGCGVERECGKNDFHFLNDSEWRKCPPLLCCWTMLYRSVESKDGFFSDTVEAINALAQSLLHFCIDGKSLNVDAVVVLKFLCGIPDDNAGINSFPEENINYFTGLYAVLSSTSANDSFEATPERIYQVAESVKLLLLLLQKPCDGIKLDDIIDGERVSLPSIDIQGSSLIRKVSSEKVDDHLYLGGLSGWFSWELPETLPDRLTQTGLPIKRRIPQAEGSNRRARGENSVAEITNQNSFSRGSGPSAAPSGPSRRDTFRQRKPNTSRPPSMHVDDYVARERSVDAVGNSNVISIHRIGSGGGRPPSIHVDEFMARQRERQNPPATAGSEPSQAKNITTLGNNADTEKANKPKHLKSDLDDDLHGIDIVFDGEESETDDRLPFLQPDDNLQQPAPVMAEQRSPHSVVEETESDVNESNQYSRMGTPITSNAEENAQSEFSSKMSISRPEVRLTREPSVSSEKRFFDSSDDSKNALSVKNLNSNDLVAASNRSGFSAPTYSSAQMPVDSRMAPNNFYPRSSLQYANSVAPGPGSRGMYEQKVIQNQPPLPPMPPPSTFSPVQSEHLSAVSGSPILPTSLPAPDSKFTRSSMSSPGGSVRHAPPLPSTPPPITSSPYSMPSLKPTNNLVYNQAIIRANELPQSSGPSGVDARFTSLPGTGLGKTSYPPSLLVPSLVYNRPASIPGALYGADNPSGGLQNPPLPQLLTQSMQSLAQLQPLQQLQRPMQPSQHLRPPIQASQQTDQGLSLQTSVQIQMQQLQMLQQPQLSSVQTYYQSRHQEFSSAQQKSQVELAQPQTLPGQGGATSLQQQDPGMSLHKYFQSPEAIQALLSDRDKLCQLLEQHPKLMQMLQEKLGQL